MSAARPPDPVDSMVGQALERHRVGRLQEAEALYRQALAAHPRHPDALHYLGLLGFQTGHLSPAEELLAEASRVDPANPVVLNHWGIVLAKLGRLEEARSRLHAAVERGPGYADALVNLGNVLSDLGENEEAERRYREAVAIAPRSAEGHNNLGRLLLARRRLDEAVACFEEALRANPGHAPALNNLGNALRDQGRLREAFERYRAAQNARPDHPEAFSNLLLAMNCDPDLSSDEILAAHREFAERFERPLAAAAATPFPPRSGARLRVGYLSADLRNHAVAAFVEPLFAHHDRARFEVFVYSNAFVADDTTRRLTGLVEHFAVVAALTDEELSRRIRDDGIDVLVDLSGHTAGNRLLAFARRSAPVQAGWLGYLNTSGLQAMDFRITDPWTDPPGTTEHLHSENLVRLPGSLWCYRPWIPMPPATEPPHRARGHFTFASTNNPAKLNPSVLQAWANILVAVPGSRIVIHLPEDGDFRSRVLAILGGGGVARERVEFFPRLAAADYLARYAAFDLVLDTFPCPGGTTSLDALWMGVPVLALAGDRPFSRGGASILGNLGMTGFLASSPRDYVDKAIAFAKEPAPLDEVRATLRERLAASALMDGPRFARGFEEALAGMCAARGIRKELSP